MILLKLLFVIPMILRLVNAMLREQIAQMHAFSQVSFLASLTLLWT